MTATARAQTQLRQVLTYNGTHAALRPEVLIGRAPEKFHGHGQLNDETATRFIRELLDSLYELAKRL